MCHFWFLVLVLEEYRNIFKNSYSYHYHIHPRLVWVIQKSLIVNQEFLFYFFLLSFKILIASFWFAQVSWNFIIKTDQRARLIVSHFWLIIFSLKVKAWRMLTVSENKVLNRGCCSVCIFVGYLWQMVGCQLDWSVLTFNKQLVYQSMSQDKSNVLDITFCMEFCFN